MRTKPAISLFDRRVTGPAFRAAFAKLDPRLMAKNPVMFVTEVVAALATLVFLRDLAAGGANLAVAGHDPVSPDAERIGRHAGLRQPFAERTLERIAGVEKRRAGTRRSE